MRAILDEGVPRRLAHALRQLGHDVSLFPSEWKGLKNGQLLMSMEASAFDCLLTCDKNLSFQQAIERRAIGLVVLPAQRFEDLQPLLQHISNALLASIHGETIMVPVGGRT